MWNGKNKAITFSFDDGVKQDIRVIEIMEKYGLKGTFNLNSANLGRIFVRDEKVTRYILPASMTKELYKNQEVAGHTMSHFNLIELDDDTVIRQVGLDARLLEELVGYPITAMAYPCGGVNNDARVKELIRNNTGIQFARTITSTYSFDMQDDLLCFNPTVHYCEINELFSLAEKFINLKTDKPQVFYIWGHTYELDEDCSDLTWEQFEDFCRLIANKDDIFYGTNSQVFLNK